MFVDSNEADEAAGGRGDKASETPPKLVATGAENDFSSLELFPSDTV